MHFSPKFLAPKMQRIKEAHKKKDGPQVSAVSLARRVAICNDILFLLSLANPNIRRVLPKLPIGSGKDSLRRTDLRVEHSHSFDTSLRFYTNLRLLEIKNASIVKFRALDGKNLDVLVLDSVSRFDFSEDPTVSVCQLVLKNIRISAGDFSCMMSILSPSSLRLIGTHLLETTAGAPHQALSKIMEINLCCVETKDSFLDFGRFLYLVREKRMRKFSFASKGRQLSYSSTGTSLSHLIVSDVDDRASRLVLGLDAVDVLILKAQQSLAMLSDRITKEAKHIVLKNAPISQHMLKRLGKPTSIVLEQCSFESLCFYEFVDLFCDSLRYLSLKGTEVPLDCVAHMRRKLVDCRVELNGCSLFYVPGDV